LDKNGNPLKMTEIPGSNFNLKVDLVFIAMGFLHVRQNKLLKNLKLEYDKKGNIKIDKNYKTSAKGVFAAGDAVTGASLVVRAIYYGYEAAKCINEYLK